MAIEKSGVVGRQLRTLFNVGAIRELTDGQLLERFATDRGEVAELAFAALVERHGPMVLRVCRGVLDEPQDIQDTFQATFLVLVTKARALWVRDSLGPWLHQVAYRTASGVRVSTARRRRLEGVAAASRREPRAEAVDDLGRVLHEEIDRLPDRFRAPVILCDLEGRTHEQAARHLGWPIGTVKSRQARARERLRDQLIRRGFAPGVGVLGVSTTLEASSLSPGLVDSTTVAAVRFVASRAIVPGSAAALAQGMIRSMAMTRWFKAASILLALGAAGSGVGLLAQDGRPGGAPGPGLAARADDPKILKVKPGPLKVAAIERGSVEPSRAMDLLNEVEGNTTIISLKPEGSRVSKGEVLVELDSAALRDSLVNQRITIQMAEGAYRQSVGDREVAEGAVKEYTEGTLVQDRAMLNGRIVNVEEGLRKGEARIERTRRARKRLDDSIRTGGGAVTSPDIVADLQIDDSLDEAELNLSRLKFDLEMAKSEQSLLEKYTRDKTIRHLSSEVEQARAQELGKRSRWELEKVKAKKLERQIERCSLRAPGDGVLVYANDPARGQPLIEEGATVRERQRICRVIDLSDPMRLNVKVHESLVDQVLPGMTAQIRVDALPGRALTGSVLTVRPRPDPNNRPDGLKLYTTFVAIDQGKVGLRPGMSAQVEILIKALDNVLSVPDAAVVRFDDKDHVAIPKPEGQVEWREVTLGLSNGESVEVKAGLNPGDLVILDPVDRMPQEIRRKTVPQPTRPAGEPK